MKKIFALFIVGLALIMLGMSASVDALTQPHSTRAYSIAFVLPDGP